MRQAARTLVVQTQGQGLVEVTREVAAFVGGEALGTGLLTVFCRHTSASLLIQENADPDVRRDLEDYVAKLAPESGSYRHQDEGPNPTLPYFACAPMGERSRRRAGRG